MEDMEFCFRAKKIGFLTYFYPKVKLIHKELGSSNREFAILSIYKGLLYFYKKHKSGQFFIVKLLLVAKALVSIFIGFLTNSSYLKNTYRQGLKLAI
jgi:GT2 family glycosyltransferase